MRSRALAFVAIAAASLVACAGLLGIDDRFYDGAPDAPPGDAPPPPPDAPSGDAPPDGSCPSDMLLAGSFCIDRTEVTQQDYAKFVQARAGDASGQTAFCAWNDELVAPSAKCSGFALDPSSTKPMACVDWCDAVFYCASRGKRLCGSVDGGPVPSDGGFLSAIYESTSDEWYAACSRQADGMHLYPYGNSYNDAACNGYELGEAGTVPVGTLPSCVGGYEGLHDMSGNVREWEDSCEPKDGGFQCIRRGGGYGDSNAFGLADYVLSCKARVMEDVTMTDSQLGFRCCAP